MAVSDSIALSSPFVPKRPTQAEIRREQVLSRGNTLVPCPACHAPDAEKEPPVSVVRCGEHYLQGVTRCLKCGPQLETVKAPLFEPWPEPFASITREEPAPMITSEAPLCECGCGESVTVDKSPAGKGQRWRRFASKKCAGRAAGKKSSPSPEVHPGTSDFSCQGPAKLGTSDEFAPGPGGLSRSRPGPSGEGTPPPIADLSDPSTWKPGAIVEKPADWFTPPACPVEPSPRAQALAYLLSLSQEQRDAFGALLEAEATCRRLGVA